MFARIDRGTQRGTRSREGEFTSLSAAQRLALPDGTPVTVRGRTTAAGALLAEHRARMERFRNAAALGAGVAQTNPQPLTDRAFSPSTRRPGAAPVILNPGALSAATAPVVVFDSTKYATDPNGQPNIGIDYRSFCLAAKATICLYFPGGTHLTQFKKGDAVYAQDYDDYLDRATCTSLNGRYDAAIDNGVPRNDGGQCVLYYPSFDKQRFNAGAPPAAVVSGTCAASDGFDGTVDTHGYIDSTWTTIVNTLNLEATPLATCVIRVSTPGGLGNPHG